jgi:hypothetical protein
LGVGIAGNYAHMWVSNTADPAGEPPLCGGGAVTQPTEEPATEPTAAPVTEPTTEPVTEPTAAPITEPTAAPVTEPTAAPVTEPTTPPDDGGGAAGGAVLATDGEITAGGSAQHTFNVAAGGSYLVLITPSSAFDVAPAYSCTVQGGSSSGAFDVEFEGGAETTTIDVTAAGTCTLTIEGFQGSTGTYTVLVTAQ